MRESKFATSLRVIGVHNNYGMLERFGTMGDVTIEYHSGSQSILGDITRTTVWSVHPHPKLKVDERKLGGQPEKTFIGNRAATFQLAVNWAMEQFGHDYEPSPFGGRLPSHVLHKARRAAVTNRRKIAP